MISSKSRMRAYTSALRNSISRGDIVVDIGCGTGIFSLLACQFGASKVYAIEPADSICFARESARANGFDGRIEFIQDLSTAVSLTERADVIVSDLRGVLPFFGSNIPSIVDARERMLAPGGTLIASDDTLWVAAVEAPTAFDRLAMPWRDNEFDLDLSSAARSVFNTWGKAVDLPCRLLSSPHVLFHLDYNTVSSPNFSTRLVMTATNHGSCHGLFVWFDSNLGWGQGFSNAPGVEDSLYGRGYFPWPEVVELEPGDQINVAIRADLVGPDYIWTWVSEVHRAGKGKSKSRFNQSTFFGVPISPEKARKRALDYRPKLDAAGEMNLQVLRMMDGDHDLAEIAEAMREQFPGKFPSTQAAIDHVADISQTHG